MGAAMLLIALVPWGGSFFPDPAIAEYPAPVASGAPMSPRLDDCLIAGRLSAHMQYLGSDSLRGRAPGTAGGAAAAAYIAARLAAFGVEPAGSDGSWYQQVPMHGGTPLPGTRLRIEVGRSGSASRGTNEITLRLGEDYVVFVGYGIVAPEYDYDDYRAVEVREAVVAYLEGEPESSDPSFFAGDRRTVHAFAETKRREALARGVRGSILLHPPADAVAWSDLQRDYGFEHRTLAYDISRNLTLVLNATAGASLFHGADHSLDEVGAMKAAGTVRSFPLATRLSFRGRFRERDFTAPNVAGVVRGSDPLLRDEWVLLSAHYDGLGVGPPVRGDSIYNGVVDNASGTAALLEIARAFAAEPSRLRRSVILLFTTGEESGLLGALYYCDHPLVPLHRTVADLNLDGLAFLDLFDDVVPVGSEEMDLGGLLGAVAVGQGLNVSRIPALFSLPDEFLRGDHYAFAVQGVPSFLVQEGISYRHLDPVDAAQRLLAWGRETYHSPFDDLSQPIRLEASCQHLALLAALAESLACTSEPPQWRPGSPFAGARLRARAEGR
jgi:Zn-dependent M28 family amino/carboxypeptidase